jgi:hypothetical protein
MAKKMEQLDNVAELYPREIDWRKVLQRKYGTYFKTNDELLELADKMRKKPPRRVVGDMSRATLNYLLGKSRDTYQSTQILCKTGFGRDALILVRSLLENLIIILYMFEDEKGIEERIREWIQFDLRDRKILLDAIEREPTDLFKVKGKWLNKKCEIRESYEQLPEKIKKKQGWSYEQLARKVGLEAQYIYYRHLSSLAHPTSTSAKGYMMVEKNRVVIRVGPGEKAIPNALVFSHRYFLMILNKVNSVFDLNEDENLEKHERLYSIRKQKMQL